MFFCLSTWIKYIFARKIYLIIFDYLQKKKARDIMFGFHKFE